MRRPCPLCESRRARRRAAQLALGLGLVLAGLALALAYVVPPALFTRALWTLP